MKKIAPLLILLGLNFSILEATERCQRESSNEVPYLVQHVFSAQNYEDLREHFEKIYSSPGRLAKRVYWDEPTQNFRSIVQNQDIEISQAFIQNIQQHVSISIERGYADFAIYADMGHGHILFPNSLYEQLRDQPATTRYQYLGEQDVKVLYHTAEQVRMRSGTVHNGPLPTDPWLAWRYFSRNIVGDNHDGQRVSIYYAADQSYNTVRQLDNHLAVGMIYLTAHPEGCFSYERQGETIYYDMSFELPRSN